MAAEGNVCAGSVENIAPAQFPTDAFLGCRKYPNEVHLLSNTVRDYSFCIIIHTYTY